MAITIIHAATSTMVGYGEILPTDYKDGEKLPVGVFMHGIGEISSKKSLADAVNFHYWLKTAADKKRMVWLVPQDNGTNLFDDKELVQLIPTIKNYWNEQLILSGLSRGGGTTISTLMSNSVLKAMVTTYLILCPPTWESMDEKLFAADDTPVWIFFGAKDAAVSISSIVNTVDDVIKAGRTKNFYFSVFPNDDHFIWNEVMGRIGVPPISPADGATEWVIKDSTGKIIYQVACVNNPAVDVYDFALMQKKGDYKPLPLLTDEPEEQPAPIPTPTPIPEPVPTPTPVADVYYRNFIVTGSVYGITWSDGTKTTWKTPTGATVKQAYTAGDSKADKQYLKVEYLLGAIAGSKVFGPKK